MPKMNDITDKRFGKLVAICPTEERTWGKVVWRCHCDCGNWAYISNNSLSSGRTQSCGCLHEKAVKQHGDSYPRTRLYITWQSMCKRCNNPNNKNYKSYGGRGIVLCDEWHDYLPFKQWALANGYGDDLTIDRIDNDGNYEPSNCRWITKSENSKRIPRNKRGQFIAMYQKEKL